MRVIKDCQERRVSPRRPPLDRSSRPADSGVRGVTLTDQEVSAVKFDSQALLLPSPVSFCRSLPQSSKREHNDPSGRMRSLMDVFMRAEKRDPNTEKTSNLGSDGRFWWSDRGRLMAAIETAKGRRAQSAVWRPYRRIDAANQAVGGSWRGRCRRLRSCHPLGLTRLGFSLVGVER